MFSCPLCSAEYDRRKDVDEHLKSAAHAENTTPYGCNMCTSSFSTEKASKVHMRKRHATTIPVATDEDGGAQKRQCVGIVDCPFVGTLLEWVYSRYNNTRATTVEHLSSSTIARIEAFSVSLRFENDQTLTQILEMEENVLLDIIDVYVDKDLEANSPQTVNNHLRYLKIILLFHKDHIDHTCVDDVVIDYITDLVTETQSTTTRANTTLNMLKLEDPFALAKLRDELVNALLREQVEVIHPYILTNILSTEISTEKHLEFGARLRNWIELAIRYTNIPCRIQCTRELLMEDDLCQNYVCKLVLRENQFCRLVNQDKTAGSHQPLLLPLGRMLSSYLYFYITYCRPDTDHSFVFCTRRGAKWSRPSRDLKIYIESTLGIPVHSLDPTGRFIHASRAIMMAVFAIGVDFDQQKMHGFARLLRHSSTTNEMYYSMWQHRALSNQAIDVFANLMGIGDIATLTPSAYIPVKLREVPSRMTHSFLRGFGANVSRTNIVPCYGTCSVGTQTGTSSSDDAPLHDNHQSLAELDLTETQPMCSLCGKFTLELYGPFGSIRRKRYFGRYFLACACHMGEDGRFDLPKCMWYPLGHVPMQKSKSSRPRNMAEIQNFIDSGS